MSRTRSIPAAIAFAVLSLGVIRAEAQAPVPKFSFTALEPKTDPGPEPPRGLPPGEAVERLHQTVAAYHEDIGISSDYLPAELEHPQAGLAGTSYDRVSDPEIPAAVVNAVVDALAPYGVVHMDMPCTPARVWAAIQGRATPPI